MNSSLESKIQDLLDHAFFVADTLDSNVSSYITARDILEIVAEHLAGVQLGLFE